MDKQKTTYTGRFGQEAASRPKAAAPRKKAAAAPDRKPSGFSAAGQAPKRRPAAPAPEAPIKDKKPPKEKKIKRQRPLREPGERSGRAKIIALAALAAVLVALALIMIFGDRGTYHMMPTITREETQEASAPDEAILAGLEVN